MNDERWTLVDRLLGEALERQPHERQAFLREACGGDEALRLDVESLVTHASSGADVLRTPAVALLDDIRSAGTSMVGRHVGPYAIAARLGAGGMGEVYRARDTKLGRDVAIKILPRIFATDPDRRARLDREARLLAALNHPHIGAIYGLEALDGTPALVLELVDGDTLAERIAKGPIPLTEALRIARQIADALDAAHEKGIVHRDLKPANIKITPDDIVKVLDFGLAKAAGGDGSGPDLTQSPTVALGGTHDGVILGTAPYMSPEQARGKAVDKRTDVWAFGCVLFEMLTGRVAFAGDTLSDTIAAILERDPDWSALPATTPGPVRRLLLRCVDKDAKRRLRDIGDARTEIDDVVSGVVSPPAAALAPASTPEGGVAHAPVTSRRGALVLAVLMVVLAGATGVYLATRGAPGSSPSGTTLSPQGATFIPLTTTGNTKLPAISSDGKRFTYVQRDAKGESLWIQQTSTRNPPLLLVPAEPGVRIGGATITPDGDSVDFLKQTRGNNYADNISTLMRVSSTSATTPQWLIDNVGTPVAYSPDGKSMAFIRQPPGGSRRLILADAQGQNEAELATVVGVREPFFSIVEDPGFVSADVRPAWSPNGGVIAVPGVNYIDGKMTGYTMFVTVADKTIRSVPETRGLVAWIDDSSLVVSRSEDGKPSQLWRLSYPEGKLSPLTNDPSDWVGVSISDDRASIVTTRTDNRVGVWVGDGAAKTGNQAVMDAARPMFNGSSVAWMQNRLLYHSRVRDGVALSSKLDGKASEKIVANADAPATTSDGGTIVYRSTRGATPNSLWRADADGTRAEKLVDWGLWPVITPDDQHVIFMAPEGGNRPHRVSIKGGGQAERIIDRAVSSLDVSHDGQLAFTSGGDKTRVLVVCDLKACESTQRDMPLVNSQGQLRIRWTPDRANPGVAYVRQDGQQQNIWVQRLDRSAAYPLTTFTDGRDIIDFAWSRDGQHLAIARPMGISDIFLLKGLWQRP